MKANAQLASLFSMFVGVCLAQGADVTPEKAAIDANDRAFEAAYAKADAKAVSDMFTDDAEYTADDGHAFIGRNAIQDVLSAGFRANQGAKLTIQTDSVRLLAPDVVLAKGSTAVTAKDAEVAGSLFTAIYTKKDGKWKISQLIESPLPEISPADHLAEIAWLVGEWEEADDTAGVTIHSRYQWARGGAFLTRTVTVKRGEETVLEGWQIIGWDPVGKGIRSWTFDGEGGFSEGSWTREGQRWLVREKGYSGDGARTTSEQTISKASEDRFFLESGNRTLDGDPLPGIGRIEILRVKGK